MSASLAPGEPPRLEDLATPEVVRLDRISRVYAVGSTQVHAVDDVTLHLHAGEFVALMGPSGSGKSTLLNLIGLLDSPSTGSYWLDGEPVEALTENALADIRQRKIGFVFQSYHLVPRMSAARNVELPLILAGVAPERRRERVRRVLEAVGLSARAVHRPNQLSGGERQRVAIARAIVMEPRLLLADEPTGNLDSRTGEEIVALLERLNAGGLTIVLVTHDPRVGAHARHMLRMHDGKLTADEAGAALTRSES